MKYTPVGVDIAKHLIQVHFIDENTGDVVAVSYTHLGDRCAPAGLKKILNRRKPDLRGRKDANDMIIKNTHKIISEIRSTQIM